jgi:asparagine synthase (glutamine-hydrolysing)
MCGICGILAFNESGQLNIDHVASATKKLEKRGPDAEGIHIDNTVGLGHRRLSIIDTTDQSNQPFTDETGRYIIVFNGEIFNYLTLKEKLINFGCHFKTSSDTEVLLQMYIHYKEKCLTFLNGFFAFAIYDNLTKELFLARDRFGIKPLIYFKDENQFIFSSNMDSLLAFPIKRELDHTSLNIYLQLNYLPEPHSFIQNVKKLDSGSFAIIQSNGKIQMDTYYQLEITSELPSNKILDYESTQKRLISILEESVQQRMVADVPLGTFLSGGIDSSIITAIAARSSQKTIETFSIGFKDEPLYDETKYAELVANKYQTNHHTFKLSNADLLDSFYDFMENIDEPFADSSALAVNILSRETKKHVTVALSGDGADEVFSGYHKHMAEFQARKGNLINKMVSNLGPVWQYMPQSRNSKTGNLFRKLSKFSEGLQLSNKDRYWSWASLMDEASVTNMLLKETPINTYFSRKEKLLSSINSADFNEVLLTDVKVVLKGDMLKKVDSMSMRNGLEVRVPFLDHRLVEFAFSLPSHYKIDGKMKKKILQDAGRHLLPNEIYNRPKHGFEVPLVKWFNKELKSLIHDDLLSDEFIKNQNLFNLKSVKELKNKLQSTYPGDSPATIFALLIFNNWWKKYLS